MDGLSFVNSIPQPDSTTVDFEDARAETHSERNPKAQRVRVSVQPFPTRAQPNSQYRVHALGPKYGVERRPCEANSVRTTYVFRQEFGSRAERRAAT